MQATPRDRLFFPSPRQIHLLIVLGFASVGYALYLRYLVVEMSSVGLTCQAGAQTWLCFTRKVMIALFTNGVFGTVALVVAGLNLLRPSIVLLVLALVSGGFGIVLYNVGLSALAAGLLVLSLARPAPGTV